LLAVEVTWTKISNV